MPFAISFTDIKAARTKPTRSVQALHPHVHLTSAENYSGKQFGRPCPETEEKQHPDSPSGYRNTKCCSLPCLGAHHSTVSAKPGSWMLTEGSCCDLLSHPGYKHP